MGFYPLKWGRWTFFENFTPRNQRTTKTRFWVQRAPSQSLPGKLEVRSGNQNKARSRWTFHTHPQTNPFTYTFRFVLVGWGHRRNHPCQVSSQSVQQFRLLKGSKITISHRLGEWLLQQCYALTCYTVMISPREKPPQMLNSCFLQRTIIWGFVTAGLPSIS